MAPTPLDELALIGTALDAGTETAVQRRRFMQIMIRRLR